MGSTPSAAALLLPLQKLDEYGVSLLLREVCEGGTFALQEGKELGAGDLWVCHIRCAQPLRGANMSGGEQQMLTVARTLMGNPLLVLLDEPSEGVAPVIVEEMADTIMS